MSLFGPKEPCEHCGRKVKRPEGPGCLSVPALWETGALGESGSGVGVEGPGSSPGPLRGVGHSARYQQCTACRRRIGASGRSDSGGLLRCRSRQDQLASLPGRFDGCRGRRSACNPEESTHLAGMLSVPDSRGTTCVRPTWVVEQLCPLHRSTVGSYRRLPRLILQKKGEIVHYECEATLDEGSRRPSVSGGLPGFQHPDRQDGRAVPSRRFTGAQRAGWNAAPGR